MKKENKIETENHSPRFDTGPTIDSDSADDKQDAVRAFMAMGSIILIVGLWVFVSGIHF